MKMTWANLRDQRNANGELTDIALAADALVDNGCDCGEDEPGTCLVCLCEKALKELLDQCEKLSSENDALAHDYKLSLEQYDKFLKNKLICSHCDLSFVAVNAVQVGSHVYCSEECAAVYRH